MSPRPQARAKLDQLPDHDSDSNAAGDSLDHLGMRAIDCYRKLQAPAGCRRTMGSRPRASLSELVKILQSQLGNPC